MALNNSPIPLFIPLNLFGFNRILLDFDGSRKKDKPFILKGLNGFLDVMGHYWIGLVVEAAGIEPASASPLPLVLHV